MKPVDGSDEELLRQTAPTTWVNPDPKPLYDLVVIGGGPAGLVAAHGAAGVGAKVALIEKGLLGGDCLVSGCVPSKALLASARAARAARRGAAYGVHTGEVSVDFGEVMRRMRSLRAHISPADSAARLQAAGVDVFFGAPRFVDAASVEVGGATLAFRAAVIATGARASVPPIPGLDAVGALTNESLFALTELPKRLLILGAGVIGVEMATAFSAFGSAVTLVDQAAVPLPRGDADASGVIAHALRSDGVTLRLGAKIERLERRGGEVVAWVDGAEIAADAVLVALGRQPNVEGLDLDKAGVTFGRTGVVVDDFLRTSNPRVFGAGDVTGGPAFTHAADAMARMVIQNALFFGRKRVSSLIIPSATYTSPEVAQVGPADLDGRPGVITLRIDHAHRDRLELDGDTRGFTKIHADARGIVLGATWVGPRAGDLIGEVALLMQHRIPLGSVGAAIRPYPSESEVLKALGDAWNRRRLTPTTAWLLRLILATARRLTHVTGR